jgi:hypothetical protein
MTDKFYHVLGAIGDRKTEVLFSDLTAKELRKQFVVPYIRGWCPDAIGTKQAYLQEMRCAGTDL